MARKEQTYYINKEATEAEPRHFEAVNGKPIVAMDGIETFIYWNEQARTWVVTEVRTGSMIATASTTQKKAIEQAREFIEFAGKENMIDLIEQMVAKYGEAPKASVDNSVLTPSVKGL